LYKDKVRLVFYLILLLVVSFSLVNFIIYLKVKDIVQDSVYAKAYVFYLTGGKEYADTFVFWNEKMQGYKVYTFSSQNPPFITYVGIPEKYIDDLLNKLFFSILGLEFILTLLFTTLYIGAIESFTKRIEQQSAILRDLGLAIMHKAGNFIAIQKLNLKLLQQSLASSPILRRMEKSLSGFQKDINLISHILEEKETKKEYLNLKQLLEDTLEDIAQDYPDKKLVKNLKDAFIYADAVDVESILYNLLANAFKHSVSYIHIKLCINNKNKTALLAIRNDIGVGSGTGIGLKLLQRAVERQSGKLSIRIKKRFTAFVSFPSF